jgi:hypothetical protein
MPAKREIGRGRFKVHDQRGHLSKDRSGVAQILQQLLEDDNVLLDHNQPRYGGMQVRWGVERKVLVFLLKLEGAPVRHPLVVRPFASETKEGESNLQLSICLVARVQRLLQPSLCLVTQEVHGSAQDDSQAISGVQSTGDDAGPDGRPA